MSQCSVYFGSNAKMVKAYGPDLRWRVIFLYFIFREAPKKIAEILVVSQSWVNKMIRLYRRKNNVTETPRLGRPRVMSGEYFGCIDTAIKFSRDLRHICS